MFPKFVNHVPLILMKYGNAMRIVRAVWFIRRLRPLSEIGVNERSSRIVIHAKRKSKTIQDRRSTRYVRARFPGSRTALSSRSVPIHAYHGKKGPGRRPGPSPCLY